MIEIGKKINNLQTKDVISFLERDLDGILLPKNKTECRVLEHELSRSSHESPLEIFVGSCPDYSHSNGLYDHQSLGSNIPLLTSYHLKSSVKLLRTLDHYGVPYIYNIALADVEATDKIFATRFTGGDEAEFLNRCNMSVNATQKFINNFKVEHELKGVFVSTSFFEMFTREKFMDYQDKYKQLLNKAYKESSKYQTRINSDTIVRMNMYQKMYNGVTDEMNVNEKHTFYVSRTIRTMAQYLTLGRLIAENLTLPVIISHPTRNMSVFNDRNKLLFAEDNNQPQLTIPIFEMNTKVY